MSGLGVAAPFLSGNGNGFVIGTKVSAEASAIPASVTCVLTSGYNTAGDGGGAFYVQGDATTPGGFIDAGGIEWELAKQVFNPIQFGARGDGSDDGPACNDWIDCVELHAGEGHVPAGFMFTVGEILRIVEDDFVMTGKGGFIWDTAVPNANQMLLVTGNNCLIDGPGFFGDVYTAYGDTINPGSLVKVGSSGNGVEKITVQNSYFEGGIVGLGIWSSEDVTLNSLEFYKQYGNGCFTSSGVQRCIVNGFKARDVGLYEGFKFGQADNAITTEFFIMADFEIIGCGRLDPTTSLHQEGLDVFVGDARYIEIGQGQIAKCGNGGVEYKTRKSSAVGATDVFESVWTHDVHVLVEDGNQPAFVCNWSSGHEPTVNPDKARRFKFADCTATYSPAATDTSGSMFAFDAFSEITISDCECYDGGVFIRTSGDGGYDKIIRNIYVNDCFADVVKYGIYHANGGLEGLYLNNFTCFSDEDCIITSITASALPVDKVEIKNSRLICADNTVNHVAVSLSAVVDILIDNSYLEAEYRCVYAPNTTPNNDGGTVKNNTLVCRTSGATPAIPLVVFEGTWEYWGNDLSGCPLSDFYGWVNFGTATVNAARNIRGRVPYADIAATINPAGGNLGDIFLLTGYVGGEFAEVHCTGSGQNNATWRTANPVTV